jgi:hypothetical protein
MSRTATPPTRRPAAGRRPAAAGRPSAGRSSAPSGRFATGRPAGRRAAAPSSSPFNRPSWPGRAQPKPSKASSLLSTIGGIAKSSSSSKPGRSGPGKGGLALLAAGVGLAVKNRDKLPLDKLPIGGKGKRGSSEVVAPASDSTPVTSAGTVSPMGGTEPIGGTGTFGETTSLDRTSTPPPAGSS